MMKQSDVLLIKEEDKNNWKGGSASLHPIYKNLLMNRFVNKSIQRLELL